VTPFRWATGVDRHLSRRPRRPSASLPPPMPRLREWGERSGRHAASAQDATWLTTGIQGDRFEIAGGTAAQSKGATTAMKAFGARLVKDHTKSLKDAERAARRFGVDVPKTPSPSE
jgi:hypothetical protein